MNEITQSMNMNTTFNFFVTAFDISHLEKKLVETNKQINRQTNKQQKQQNNKKKKNPLHFCYN